MNFRFNQDKSAISYKTRIWYQLLKTPTCRKSLTTLLLQNRTNLNKVLINYPKNKWNKLVQMPISLEFRLIWQIVWTSNKTQAEASVNLLRMKKVLMLMKRWRPKITSWLRRSYLDPIVSKIIYIATWVQIACGLNLVVKELDVCRLKSYNWKWLEDNRLYCKILTWSSTSHRWNKNNIRASSGVCVENIEVTSVLTSRIYT
jgi:hypothetical protein